MSIPDISKFSNDDWVAFLDSFDTILTDCDGVIWLQGDPLDGAVDAVTALEALGKRIFYVTNNATRTVAHYVTALGALGFSVTEAQVVTPAVTVAQVLRDRGCAARKAHVIAGPAFRSDVLALGVRCTQPAAPDVLSLDAIKQHLRHGLDRDVGAVVLDFSAALSYLQLLEASLLLKQPDCLFVAGATDHVLQLAPDLSIIGTGYFVEMLESFTGREPVLAAKPSPFISAVVAARHPTLDPGRTLFIGDSLEQDIAQGILSGFHTLLVLSGISTLEEAENAPPEQRPEFVAPSLKAMVPALQHLACASRQQHCKK